MTPWHLTQHNALVLTYSKCKGRVSVYVTKGMTGAALDAEFAFLEEGRDNSFAVHLCSKTWPSWACWCEGANLQNPTSRSLFLELLECWQHSWCMIFFLL